MLLIKIHLIHIVPYFPRHHWAYVFSFLDSISYKGGRKFDNRGVNQSDFFVVCFCTILLDRIKCTVNGSCGNPGIDIYWITFQNQFVVFPLRKAFQVVLAHNQTELLLRIFFFQMDQGMYGIIGLGKMEFHIARLQFWIFLYGNLDHGKAMVAFQQGFFLFMGIVRGYNKPNFIKIAELHQKIGNDQMPNMDGIERAKEKSCFFTGCWFDVDAGLSGSYDCFMFKTSETK